MELKVLQNPPTAGDGPERPWYDAGLRFTCTQCGNCCTGGPGYVWISRQEIARMAEYLQISRQEVIARYCREVDGKCSLRENRNARGEYDCIFLREEQVCVGDNSEQIVHTRRVCTVYPVRPLQCRTWPFWSENLRSPEAWNRSAQRCHGMNHGQRHFTRQQIEALRDARDWPQDPPTSG
ncbi:YkgJ family cysteine cluster protein [Fontivita pretiosa]|uniref:YkgJ family cysteine cluster protein n=1 Tax=Fontivita pretiosa TaxID=2989684 RepID=UPI003D178A60